jgi:hypothetical protein
MRVEEGCLRRIFGVLPLAEPPEAVREDAPVMKLVQPRGID